MGLSSLVRSRGFKNFMSKLYGWGAAVVILGALFKINHYDGADIMLIIGLGTESLIFFFSAFEPPYVEPDWSLVYPELAGIYHGAEAGPRKPSEKLDKMFAEANIEPELIEKLGAGMQSLSENAGKLKDVTDASVATNEYVSNMRGASSSVGELTDAYKRTTESLNQDANASVEYINNVKEAASGASNLAHAYQQVSEAIKSDMGATAEFAESVKGATESANSLADKYDASAEMLVKSAEMLDFSSIEESNYKEQIQKIADNLSALNAVYELQLQGTNQQVETSARMQETMNQFLSNLDESSDKLAEYKTQMDELNERMNNLSKVYGNMLSAMNING